MEAFCPSPPHDQYGPEPQQSWVTLATDDTYAFGALVLGYSLREARTRYKLTVLITRDVGAVMRHLLAQVFDDIQLVTLLRGRDPLGYPCREADGVSCSYSKLHVWRLQHLSKGVFLDADTLVVANCDELFQRRELAAAPLRGWPDVFDTGVMRAARESASFDGVDRGILNEVFGERWTKDLELRLPFVYNLQGSAGRPFFDQAFVKFGSSGAKIVHFWGSDKPWTQVYDWSKSQVHPSPGCQHRPEHLQMWWDVFGRHVQPKLARHPRSTQRRPIPQTSRVQAQLERFPRGRRTSPPPTLPRRRRRCALATGALASLLSILGDTSIANIMEGSSRTDVLRHEEDRYDAWERGEMDYMGVDAFVHIQRKLDQAIKGPPSGEKHEKDEESLSESTYLDVLTDT
ncbi:hypothetical protein MTO96_038431 [Rhipicephalus appendiculatus]